jgi:hypothetical protein
MSKSLSRELYKSEGSAHVSLHRLSNETHTGHHHPTLVPTNLKGHINLIPVTIGIGKSL